MKQTKFCRVCGTTKPYGEFSPDLSRTDGAAAYCRPCRARKRRESYARAKGGAAIRVAEASTSPSEASP